MCDLGEVLRRFGRCSKPAGPGHLDVVEAGVSRRCCASMRCAALAERGQPETRRAAHDSDIRPSFSLLASTARRYAQGNEYRQGDRDDSWLVYVLGPVAQRRRRAAAEGVRCTASVWPVCLRAAKAARVLAASLRREHRSGPAQPARRASVFFFASFRLDKQTKGSRAAARNPQLESPISTEQSGCRAKENPRRLLSPINNQAMSCVLAWKSAAETRHAKNVRRLHPFPAMPLSAAAHHLMMRVAPRLQSHRGENPVPPITCPRADVESRNPRFIVALALGTVDQ
jgi:hypothetical protein